MHAWQSTWNLRGGSTASESPFETSNSALNRRQKLLSNSDQHLFKCRGFMPISSAARFRPEAGDVAEYGRVGPSARPRHRAVESLRGNGGATSVPLRRKSVSSLVSSSSSGSNFTSVSQRNPRRQRLRRHGRSVSTDTSRDGAQSTPVTARAPSRSKSFSSYSRKAPAQKRQISSPATTVDSHSHEIQPVARPVVNNSPSPELGSNLEPPANPAGASVVVQERVIIVTPRVTVTRTSPSPNSTVNSTPEPVGSRTPVPPALTEIASGNDGQEGHDLAQIANAIQPIRPFIDQGSPSRPTHITHQKSVEVKNVGARKSPRKASIGSRGRPKTKVSRGCMHSGRVNSLFWNMTLMHITCKRMQEA